ncbi:MAG: HAD family phosphatase [Ruminococcaceae bacterium]|nr:HAD family phosphatase [Oscillospiraceae bacterium]
MEKNTYIFDFDGVLVDSMPYWSAGMLNFLDNHNIKYPDDIIKTITPLGNPGSARYFKETFGINLEIEEILKEIEDYFIPKYLYEIPLKPFVYDYLTMLKAKGYSLNVLTASPHITVDPCLKRVGIYNLFDNIWSCDDFNTTKADPDIYVKAVEKIGVDMSQAVFFDDNINAVKTAIKAGLYTVGVYDSTGEAFNEELQAVSNKYIENFGSLL